MTAPVAIVSQAQQAVQVERLLEAIAAVESGGKMAKIGLHGERSCYQLTKRAWMQVSKRPWYDAFDRRAAHEVAAAYVRYLIAELARRGEEVTPWRVALAWNVGLNGLRTDAALGFASRVAALYK